MTKTAVLYQTHVLTAPVMKEFERLARSGVGTEATFLHYDNTKRLFPPGSSPAGMRRFLLFDLESLARLFSLRLGTELVTLIPGHFHLPALQFMESHPEYDFVWRIEYDVRFTGDWRDLFEAFAGSDADLLGTTYFRYAFRPAWPWWNGLVSPEGPVAEAERIRGFFPAMRLSRRAAATLADAVRSGWRGHGEALMPTVLQKRGQVIEDIGGEGEFVRPENLHRFYTNTPSNAGLCPGTFVFRNETADGIRLPDFGEDHLRERGKLYHPVKDGLPAAGARTAQNE